MKKLLFPIVLVLSLFLCACGKSEYVQNVETLIDQIGEVSLQSDEMISAAEEAYSRLIEKDQKAVDNYENLVEARATYNALREELVKQFAGNWREESGIITETLTLLEDGSVDWHDNFFQSWDLSEDETKICLDGVEMFKIQNNNGYTELACLTPDIYFYGVAFVREDDFERVNSEKYVTVELTEENISEYLGEPEFLGNYSTDFGGRTINYEIYTFKSLAYEQGLIYLASKDLQIDLSCPWDSLPVTCSMYGLFGPRGSFVLEVDKESFSHIISVKGTAYFIRSEYVDNVSWRGSEGDDTYKNRVITLTDGTEIYTESDDFRVSFANVQY